MDYWELQARLIDNDYSSILDADACEPGMTVTWKSVAVPELSEEGRLFKSLIFELLSSVKLAA